MYLNAVAIFLALVVCIASIWIRWRKRKLGLLKRCGIPGPEPNFFTGNLSDFHEKRDTCIQELIDKYGSMVGFYFGAFPCIICSDVEFLKIMQIKEFGKFANKDFFLPDSGIPYKLITSYVEFQKDEKWKNMRTILSSSFSTGKIKMMSTLMVDPINTFIKKIEEKNGDPFDICTLYNRLTFDVICRSAFGITTNSQNNEANKFVQSMYNVLDFDSSDILASASICFPELEPVPTGLRSIVDALRNMLNLPSVRVIFSTCQEIVDSRKKSQHHSPDLLQNMIDAEDDSKDEVKTLTSDAVLANAMGFITAGLHTTASTLGWCTYLVAKHSEVQDKIRQEINDNVKNSDSIQYNDLINFQYLDQVLSETLRLFPASVIAINRNCKEDFKYKNIVIPKGSKILVPAYNIHRDPNYWHEPDKFDPDRFSLELRGTVDPIVYQPFGAGPRNCIGMKLAQTVMKLIFANLIRSFRLELHREEDIAVHHTFLLLFAKNGISVNAIPLNS